MRSIFIAFFAIVLSFTMYAQDAEKDMKKAGRLIGSYRLDPTANADKLPEARSLIDGAMSGSELANNAKAWQVYGEVYTEVVNEEVRALALDQETPIANPGAAPRAVQGYMKAYDSAEKNFEKKDALKGLSGILNNTSYMASVLLRNGDYASSYNCYDALLKGNDFLTANGEASIYENEEDFQQQVYWAALAAYSGEDFTAAESQFLRLHNEDYDSPDIYSAMFDIKNRQGDEEGAAAWLKQGIERYPGDKGLMFAEINYALSQGNLDVLEGKLKAAMEAEPDNITIPTTLGNVYDQLYQNALQEGDQAAADQYYESAKVYFAKALELDENYFDAVYMMGAVEYNRAAEYATQLNALADDYSKEGEAKYNEAKDKMLSQFDKALPYFVKAESLNADDRNTLIALREIYARKDMLDKSNEYKDKIEALPVND